MYRALLSIAIRSVSDSVATSGIMTILCIEVQRQHRSLRWQFAW